MTDTISQNEFERYLWGAAEYLRGNIDPSDYKQFIFPLLYFKRICDVYDEETILAVKEFGEDGASFPESHRFVIPKSAHWNDVRNVPKDIGVAIQRAMHEIEAANADQLDEIFGDAQWTNKERLPDNLLKDLMEHFSTQNLSLSRVQQDELGQGYEFLIKKFADDSGHTAAEFYTNRTLVKLMTLMLDPQEGESIYDPTCGSGGMLLVAALQLKEQGKEYRSLKLYGQDINLITYSIARMNLFLHGIDDFDIVRGDTLANPKFLVKDKLQQFDIVIANPPYSIKTWNRELFAADPYGRNMFGVPPQSRADYAFFQHIIKSMNPKTGRCAILFPHGVLFRDAEIEMRKKLIAADLVECVLGLGPNLFYNSPMEACVIVCRMSKPAERRHKILFINAVNEITHEKAQSFLELQHIQNIVEAYRNFSYIDGFTRIVSIDNILKKDGNMSIPLYIRPPSQEGIELSLEELTTDWGEKSKLLRQSTDSLFVLLKEARLYE
ncbi:MAG: SAM-dependent DNA methyltransferase [Nitrospirae bacterium]|nr:SAM-dependent DNA methyltransferase [Nitrospirota bacterium]